jgi:hypothetical protein
MLPFLHDKQSPIVRVLPFGTPLHGQSLMEFHPSLGAPFAFGSGAPEFCLGTALSRPSPCRHAITPLDNRSDAKFGFILFSSQSFPKNSLK